VRAAGSPPPWNYLWKPGPYPESEDAKMKAAKKYGLLYEVDLFMYSRTRNLKEYR